MENILYIFISHQNNINNIYDRIKNIIEKVISILFEIFIKKILL